jgi:pyruvate/2-oxoacid:ferredoxin oxidoreductase alpha subunit
VKVYGAPDAEVALVSWGGNKGPLLEAIKLLQVDGVKAKLIQVVYLEPFPSKRVEEELSKTGLSVLFENNVTAQLGQLIKMHTGYVFNNIGLRYDGRPFNPSEITRKVLEVLRK